ncbi:glycosyltransferase family 4 protein [Bacteroides nordii]|uniref:glycosyltransferase family 4 protein n=1 Tax=Bacteroides nordii TaxID=291645 RepID=UPI0018A9E2B7|nr:glycosyltransferase family 1 protein [Bacteroides nordii]MCQ4914109.1 glycosyltransferase family 4 protein [Bacteroides nordii]
MKILLDNIIFSLQRSGGISVVWYEFLKRILSTKHKVDLFFLEFVEHENIFRIQLDIPKENIFRKKKSFLFYERYFPLQLSFGDSSSCFIFHSSYFRVCSNPNAINITTVHDFTYEYFYRGLHKWIHCWQKYYAIRHSQYIVCISNNTKQDLLKFLPDVDEKKIRVIYNGVSDEYYPLLNINNYKLPYPVNSYLLFVGERKAYKNFDLVVKSLKYLTYKLVIVGAELEKEEQKLLDKNLSSDNYCHVGRISNYDLNILYNGAVALIYPSSYEGFGLPVIEAQKAGCPVIAYNSSSISEIIGETPLLMHRLDLQELLKKVNMLSDLELRKDVIEKGIQNAKRFSWDDMYRKLIDLYLEAYDNNKKA